MTAWVRRPPSRCLSPSARRVSSMRAARICSRVSVPIESGSTIAARRRGSARASEAGPCASDRAKSAMEVVGAWSARSSAGGDFRCAVDQMGRHGCCSTPRAVRTYRAARFADNVGWLDFTHAITFADPVWSRSRRAGAGSLARALAPVLLCFMAAMPAGSASDVDVAASRFVDRGPSSRRHPASFSDQARWD